MNRLLHNFPMFVVFVMIGLASQAKADPIHNSTATEKLKLFAVQIKVGDNWDDSKAAHEQKFFKEHSLNLKKHRDSGRIVLGARYSDIGLLVFYAKSEEEITHYMMQDPAISVGTFKFEVHPMNVFYPGLVQP